VSDARGLFGRLLRRLKAGLQTATVRSAGFSLCPTRVDYSSGFSAAWRRDYKPRRFVVQALACVRRGWFFQSLWSRLKAVLRTAAVRSTGFSLRPTRTKFSSAFFRLKAGLQTATVRSTGFSLCSMRTNFSSAFFRLKAGLQTATVRSAGFSLCPTRVDYSSDFSAA